MKKKMFTLLATLLLTFAFATTCFAAESPTGKALPAETEATEGNVNKSNTSPKTGADIAGAFVAVVTAAGVALIAKKKVSEAN